jgi:hypothetical protein
MKILRNFFVALGKVIGLLVKGKNPTVSKNEYNRRIEICNNCPFFHLGRCVLCGCMVSAKAALVTENCPKEFWIK